MQLGAGENISIFGEHWKGWVHQRIGVFWGTFSKSLTGSDEIYISGNMGAQIKVVMVHENILVDLKLEDQIKATRALAVVKKRSFANLRKPQSQASNAGKDMLKDAINEVKGSATSLQAEAFDHS